MSAARRLAVATLCALVGGLALASVPAWAAGPETPTPVTVESVKAGAATFRGELNPGKAGSAGTYELGTYEFLYRQSASECEGGSVVPESPGMSLGGGEEAVSATVSGLLPNRQYTVCLLARDEAHETTLGEPVTFKTELAPPALGEAWVTDVSSGSATFNAQVNHEGAETTYRFEYGTSEAYGSSIPLAVAGVGSGTSAVAVQAHPQNLQPATTYHFRVVASSAGGTEDGSDHSFTTQAAGGALSLLDGRQWELVSPANKHGARLEPWSPEGGLIQAAANGSGIAYLANGPVTGEPAGNRSPELLQALSRRGGGVWATQDIATPHEAARGLDIGNDSEYDLFSADLSLGIVEPRGLTPLSPEATERTPYLRENETGVYRPLVTAANVVPGTEFGGPPNYYFGDVGFLTGTPDMSHVMLASGVPLTASAKGVGGGLYEWSEGRLQLVSVLPGPGEKPSAGELGGGGGDFETVVHNAVSADGSRVVWTGAGLYLRDVAKGETLQLDLAQGGPEEGGGDFQAASSDGSKVFFTDRSRLTSGATEGDLYECDIVEAAGKLACDLSDLTVPENPGEAGAVRLAVGASEDGSYVYFLAGGVLAGAATPGQGNLYVYHDGTTSLVATLAAEDVNIEQTLSGQTELGNLSMRVSPNGRFVAFMSERSLTGYDNRDARSGEPDEEVYLYDAESRRLVCASCNPTGARPSGIYDSRRPFGPLVDEPGIWSGHWLAASVPGWTKRNLGNEVRYQPRYLSDSGQLFFNSPDALVPQDINGLEDVYEYEPGGSGSCREVNGCVGLISSGSADEESVFLDASESGDDVFFLTAAQLVEEDKDHALDVYDAHVCGGEGVPCPSVVASSPACTTADSCRGAVSPQPGVFGAPASATFSGAGNLAPAVSKPVAKATKPKARAKRKKQRKRKTRGSARKSGRAARSRRPGKSLSSARTGR
jgi:hypothetical protein